MALVSCGRSLEDYVCDNGGGRDADIGYTKMEQRYNTLQVGLTQSLFSWQRVGLMAVVAASEMSGSNNICEEIFLLAYEKIVTSNQIF